MNSAYEAQRSLFGKCKDLLFGSLPERLIAFLRLFFSGFALFAVFIDPTAPAIYLDEVYDLLSIYAVYSVLMMYLSRVWNIAFPAQVLIHIIDIAALSLAVFLTDGLDSPFFTFYTFTVFTATMRWGWRGAFSTALVLAILFVVISWNDIELTFSKDSKNNILVMRGVYLFVTAAMLGYFGAYMERSRRRLSRLAAWPIENSISGEAHPIGPLRHASNVLGAELVLVVWWERSSEQRQLAYWSPGGTTVKQVDNSEDWIQFVSRLRAADFFPLDMTRREPWQQSLDALIAGISKPAENQQTSVRSYALAPFESFRFLGCVVVVNPRHSGEDIVSLAEIVAVRIGGDLERDALTREVAKSAMMQERVRLARDMHDSVLQDLTAANLMLKTVTPRFEKEQSASLEEIRWLLANQQRRIRTFVEETEAGANNAQQVLSGQLNVLLSALERQWQCKLSSTITPPDLKLPGPMLREVFQLISEATANAVRHGQAKLISIEIGTGDDGLHIQIKDDGVGMPMNDEGSILTEPRSIRKRVANLNGTLDLGTSTVGTQLLIKLSGYG